MKVRVSGHSDDIVAYEWSSPAGRGADELEAFGSERLLIIAPPGFKPGVTCPAIVVCAKYGALPDRLSINGYLIDCDCWRLGVSLSGEGEWPEGVSVTIERGHACSPNLLVECPNDWEVLPLVDGEE